MERETTHHSRYTTSYNNNSEINLISEMNLNKKVLVISDSGFDTASDLRFSASDEVNVVNSNSFVADSQYDSVFLFGVTPTDEILANILQSMKPGANLHVEKQIPDSTAKDALSLELQIAGFVDITSGTNGSDNDIFIACKKSAWEAGEKASIKLPAVSSKWKVDIGDLAEDDLVDENELLDDGIEVTPGAGCGVDPSGAAGKKRACKNCSCGLAEMEAAEANGADVPPPPVKSSCGSCYKGDAFRCASCPFLGKPAFEPGSERVMLAGGDDI